MAANCGVCGATCSEEKDIKCSGLCGKIFHLKCIKCDEFKTRAGKKDWKCDDCLAKSSGGSNKSSASSTTTLTKEFMVNIFESFKKEVSTQLQEFKASVEFFSQKIDESNALMTSLRNDVSDMKKQNAKLLIENKELKNAVGGLEVKVRELEQYSRKTNIEISGIPITPNEDVLTLVMDVGAAIGQEVRQEQVMAAHRVPSYNTKRTPALVVQFLTRLQRDAFIVGYRNKRSLMADEVNSTFPKNKVYINEHLSPDNKLFLRNLKLEGRRAGFKYVWFRDGKFYVRKDEGERCYKINKLDDISKI